MSIKHHTQPHFLEKYSFLWSEARLVIAAVALFLGGVPPLFAIFRAPGLYGLMTSLLTISWILSGIASGYLLYRWFIGGKKLFGDNDRWDTAAFFVSVVSGLNLGITGLTRSNPGMSIASGTFVFAMVGIIYLVTAWHLWRRWKQSGEKIT